MSAYLSHWNCAAAFFPFAKYFHSLFNYFGDRLTWILKNILLLYLFSQHDPRISLYFWFLTSVSRRTLTNLPGAMTAGYVFASSVLDCRTSRTTGVDRMSWCCMSNKESGKFDQVAWRLIVKDFLKYAY